MLDIKKSFPNFREKKFITYFLLIPEVSRNISGFLQERQLRGNFIFGR